MFLCACNHREKTPQLLMLLVLLLLLLPWGPDREKKGRVRGRMCRMVRLLSSLAMKEGKEEGGRDERMVLVCSGPEGHLWVARRVLVGGRSKG